MEALWCVFYIDSYILIRSNTRLGELQLCSFHWDISLGTIHN